MTEYRKSTRTTSCCCDRLPSELLARVFELVVETAWKEGPQATPGAVEMSPFPQAEQKQDDDKDQHQIHGSFPILCRFFAFHKATISMKVAERDVSYPMVLSFVCTRWRVVAHNTPCLWSYLSVTDDSTLDKILLSLQRSKSFPLSIRVTILSQMSEMDRLVIFMDGIKRSQMERRTARLENRMAGFGSVPELGPIKDSDPLSQFRKKMLLLLQHADRWRIFHIFAEQPHYIPETTFLFGDHKAPLLQEFCLETSRSCPEMWRVTGGVRRTPAIHTGGKVQDGSKRPSLDRINSAK